jgi:hypothetical protein
MTTITSPFTQPEPQNETPLPEIPPRYCRTDSSSWDVQVLESCHSTWVFDPRRRRFRRILKGLHFAQRSVSTEWRPYWCLDLAPDGEGFTVYLNADKTRLIRSWRHTTDCTQCDRCSTRPIAREAIDQKVQW